MDEKPIHYEPHPVTPARKAELIAAGYRIVDSRFAPPAAVHAAAQEALAVEVEAEAPAEVAVAATPRVAKKAAKKAKR